MSKKLRKMAIINLALIIFTVSLVQIQPNNIIKKEEIPKGLEIIEGFKHTATSGTFSLAIDLNGNLWGWGSNGDGQLGDGTTTGSKEPKKVISNKNFSKVEVGTRHSIALDTNGNLWTWGWNGYGQLGTNSKVNSTFPKQVMPGTKFKEISANYFNSLAIDMQGNLWSWGDNYYAQVGNNRQGNDTSSDGHTIQTQPTKLKEGVKFEKVSVGGSGSCAAIDTEGNLWVWGDNSHGQLASTIAATWSVPKVSIENTKFKEVASGGSHVIAIDTEGNLWGWGSNSSGQLGLGGTSLYEKQPMIISSNPKFKTIAASGGGIAIDETGSLWTWGNNINGQLGMNNKTNSLVLVQPRKPGVKVKAVASGGGTNMVIDENNKLWVAGYNFYNAVGDGTTTDSMVFIEIPKLEKYKLTFHTNGGAINSGNMTEYIKGITTQLPTDVTREGYTFAGWYRQSNFVGAAVPSILLTDTGDKEFYAKWTPNSYKVTLHTNGGENKEADIKEYTYGIGRTLPTLVKKEGYKFAGWYDNASLTGTPITEIGKTEMGDKQYYAKWTTSEFTVTFKDGTERTDVQTIVYGQSATAPNWTKQGYVLSWDKSFTNVTSDLVVNAIWTKNEFTVTFKNGTTTEKTQVVQKGQSATAPNLTKAGYTLSWDKSFTNITSDLVVNAIWTPNTNISYKIVHHFRNLDTEVEGYTEEEERKTGTTGATVTAEYKTREGFTKNETHPNTKTSGIVTADGSLVLNLYYNRNTYNITYELNGGTESSQLTNSYIYGKEMILQTNRVTKEGYRFAGWYDNEALTGNPVTSISSTSTGNKTFYAKWIDAEQEYYILSEAYNIDLTENTITKVSPETNITEFLSKIDTNGQKKLVNARGQEVTATSLVGTGYKLQVTFKGETYTYEIAVRGDIDGNGKVTTTDLSIINQQILHKIELTGIKAKAADTDYNGKLTTTDLSMINQAVLRKITL